MHRALARMERIGLGRDDWSWGGGTVLMLRHHHRLSRDVDLFVNDVQYLSYLSPRLLDGGEQDLRGYSEQANHVRLEYPDGEVDFLAVAPVFPSLPVTSERVDGIEGPVRMMADKEILGQKLHYRAATFTGRDLFDFAAVTKANPALLADAELRHVALGRQDALRAALSSKNCELGYLAIDRTGFSLPFDDARKALLEWLG